jgi:hypothetical protein
MNHDPKEHFSDEQLEVIKNIFESEINRMLIKTIGAYVVTVGLGVMALGAGWYRLGNVESELASITDAVHQNLPSKEYVDTADLNIKSVIETDRARYDARLDRIEDKLDVIIDKI